MYQVIWDFKEGILFINFKEGILFINFKECILVIQFKEGYLAVAPLYSFIILIIKLPPTQLGRFIKICLLSLK